MKKIIIALILILVLGIVSFFIFIVPKMNMNDDITVDEIEDSFDESSSEELQDLATVSEIKRVPFKAKKEKIEKKLNPTEKYEQEYREKSDKHFGKTKREIENRKTILNEILFTIFIENDWSTAKKTATYCRDNFLTYYPYYLTDKFIDKFYEKNINDFFKIDGEIDYVYLKETPEELYLICEIYKNDKTYPIYFKTEMNNYKLDDIDFYMTLDSEEIVPLNRETFIDGINTFCLKDHYTGNKINLLYSDDLNIELKGDNYLSENMVNYMGFWKNEDGFEYSWEDKYVNISIMVDGKNGNDYEERYTVTFDYNDEEELNDISFLIQKKKLIGQNTLREEREIEQVENFKKVQEKLSNDTKKHYKEQIEFYENLDKEFKKIK